MSYVDEDTGEILDAEVVHETPGMAVAVRPPSAMEYRPQFAMSLVDMTEQVKALDQFKHTVMRDKVDYGVIPGTNKPSLLKPGAERLLQVFGLGHRMVRVGWDPDPDGKGWWGATYICEITKLMPDGTVYVVSSCEAYASYDESRYWDGVYEGPKNNRVKVGEKKGPWNTVIKMAQKRALVGACLTATGTSEFFTQDVEDYQSNNGYGGGAPAPTNRGTSRDGRAAPSGVNRSGNSPEGSSASSGSGPSEKQAGKIRALYRSIAEGYDCLTGRNEQLALASNMIGRTIASHNDMTKAEASAYIDALVKLEAAEMSPEFDGEGHLVKIVSTASGAAPAPAAPDEYAEGDPNRPF